MADVQWSNLPKDILSIIAKILNTDVDRIRHRSVCSSWRASVRPRLRPNSFPLKLPPLNCNLVFPAGGNFFLNYGTLYHLSPPKHGRCAGDPSDGWLVRVLEVSPNLFSVLTPLSPEKLKYPPGTIPKSLNLLDYRISEVCKYYCLTFFDGKRFDSKRSIPGWPIVKKVIVLRNYAVGCEFVVLVLIVDYRMRYWKFGDKEWTAIDTKELTITDVAVCGEICYAISRQGVLLSLDSSFNLSVADFPHLPVNPNCVGYDNRLVEYKSDLYAITKFLEFRRYTEEEGVKGNAREIPLELKIFKKCSDWKHIERLGNDMFISADDYSFGFSVENFRGLKGNCVYMAHGDPTYSHCFDQKLLYGAYNLDQVGKTLIMNYAQDPALLYWPPPGWLMSS